MNVFLGVDPGIDRCGWAYIQFSKDSREFRLLDCGLIITSKDKEFEHRLKELYNDFLSIITKIEMNSIFVEDLFFSKNSKTALKIAETRGVLKLACANIGLKLVELHPLKIKKALTGCGNSGKNQVGYMVQRIFNLDSVPKPDDVTDAVAIAYAGVVSSGIMLLNN